MNENRQTLKEEISEIELKMKSWPDWKLQEFEVDIAERKRFHDEFLAEKGETMTDREKLIKTIQKIQKIAPAYGWCARVSCISQETALKFMKILPTDRMTPKVSANEDGDILFDWETHPFSVSMMISGLNIYVTLNPGKYSIHIGPEILNYSADVIPPRILPFIPFKRE